MNLTALNVICVIQAVQALNICQELGTGMGPSCSRHIRMLAPAMMTSLGDSKVSNFQ